MSNANWQGIPDWLIYAVRCEHAEARLSGASRAGEEAVGLLTDKMLANDPEFARVIVERFVRSLVRAPKPRKRKRDRRRDEVLATCARLNAEGISFRAIGERLGISKDTARRMLAEWQTRLPEMPSDLIALSQPGVSRDLGHETPECDTDPNVIPFRRPA